MNSKNMSDTRTLLFIPTYNEAENVKQIYDEIIKLNLPVDILFLDDNSPDGTGQIIDTIANKDKNVFAIHRDGKLGIGSAHLTGIRWAYNHQYRTLITMDCDFTHSPSYILDLINNSYDHQVIIGSRYMRRDSLITWNLFRKSLTFFGHFLTTSLLLMPYDASGAFRLYNIENIPLKTFELTTSRGYSFFFESLFILHLNNHSIKEIPIDLPSRTYGHSKMTINDAWQSLRYLLVLFRRKIFNKKSLILDEVA
jgi:dolichol-phosphate mannosyltransferase